MNTLQIQLLGGFSVTQDGQPVTKFRSAKSRALLAYLATQPDQDHLRTKLATLLWGELPEKAAKTNLRIELSSLKKLLGAHSALEITRNLVRIHRQHVTVDVVDFTEAITAFLMLPAESQGKHSHRLDGVIDVYQGEFLAGFHVNDSYEFDDWRVAIQEQCHQRMMLALNAQQRHLAEHGHWPELAISAQRQLTIIPWTESAHRNLMQALAAQGHGQAALERYGECCRILQEELGVDPSRATREMAARLRDRPAYKPPSRHNLARQFKKLIGRETEIEHLRGLIQDERLVTLFGMGGVGKSRLAQAVAQNVLHDFADGVWFVPLANIDPGETAPDQIALAIASALGFHFTAIDSPIAELTAYLADKHTLLILDNWEHVLASAEAILYPLLHDTDIHILATSRIRLLIDGETPMQLSGLPPNQAFTLFIDRAQRIAPTITVDEHDAQFRADVFAICAQVDGLPLGIELAASWMEHFSVTEIGLSLAEIEVEPEQADELVSRHHSLSSVLEYSWRLLSQELQVILFRCSIFRGGFDRTAAATVADSGLSELSALIGHSLVQRIAAGRYDLHPLVQKFAADKLTSNPEATLQHRHALHYLTTLIATERAARATQLLGDFENIRGAWQQAVNADDAELVARAAPYFGEYIAQFGLMSDGHQLFFEVVDHFAPDPEQHELVAQLLTQQAIFARAISGMTAASTLQHRLLSLTDDVQLQVKTHIELANRYAEEGKWDQTDAHFDKAEALAQSSSDPCLYIHAVKSRIRVNALQFRGDFAAGITRLEELLALLDSKRDDPNQRCSDAEDLRIELIYSISMVAVRYGDYGLAIRCSQQILDWADEVGHQQQKVWFLLDIALSEQFAGMYDRAIAHNEEALTLADAIGAADDVALLQANLCLTMRQSGELEQGLIYGQNAVEGLRALGHARMEGQARNRVGHTLSARARWAEAYAAYGEALVVWAPQEHSNRFEAIAGRAVTAYQLGRREEAVALVAEILDYVAENGLLGLVEPILLLLNCETVLTATGQNEKARQVLRQAEAWVQMIADRISDDEVRHAFLHNRPDNQLLNTRSASTQ